ncbi:MAG TPA: hypothetical protein VF939_26550 [Puia sp.]
MKTWTCIILILGQFTSMGQQIPTGKAGGVMDTTVNNTLKLLDPASIRQNIGDQRRNFIEDEQATRVQFANKTNNEYLILYHLDGSNANSFNEFEIGALNTKKRSFKTTTFPSFYTESGVHVGMTMDSLIAIKGKKFKRTDQKGNIVLTYRVTDKHVANHILTRYNMPIYEAQYFFRGNKLIKFIFGFPDL